MKEIKLQTKIKMLKYKIAKYEDKYKMEKQKERNCKEK